MGLWFVVLCMGCIFVLVVGIFLWEVGDGGVFWVSIFGFVEGVGM
jgi:hypothetical protein